MKICKRNRKAIEEADRIDIYWTDKSQGTKFDLGMVFALRKPIKIINRKGLEKTPHKSFVNVLLELEGGNNK